MCVSHVCLLFVFRLFMKVLSILKACEKTLGSRIVHGVLSNFSQRIKGKNAKANHCEIDYFGCSKENHSNTYSCTTMSYNIRLVLGFPGDLSTCTKLVHARMRQCARHCMRYYKFPNTDREMKLLIKSLASRLLKIC